MGISERQPKNTLTPREVLTPQPIDREIGISKTILDSLNVVIQDSDKMASARWKALDLDAKEKDGNEIYEVVLPVVVSINSQLLALNLKEDNGKITSSEQALQGSYKRVIDRVVDQGWISQDQLNMATIRYEREQKIRNLTSEVAQAISNIDYNDTNNAESNISYLKSLRSKLVFVNRENGNDPSLFVVMAQISEAISKIKSTIKTKNDQVLEGLVKAA